MTETKRDLHDIVLLLYPHHNMFHGNDSYVYFLPVHSKTHIGNCREFLLHTVDYIRYFLIGDECDDAFLPSQHSSCLM